MTQVPDTTPYPWPFDGVVEPSRLALILCGADAHWSKRTPLDLDVEANIEALRDLAVRHGVSTLLLEHEPIDRPLVVESPRQSSPPIGAGSSDVVVRAAGIDGFYGSPLDALLRRTGRDHLLVAGHGLETTVHSTLRRANDRGYECLVVADACAALDPTLRHASISSIEMSGGIFGAVGTTTAVLTALDLPPASLLDPETP